MVIVKNTFLDMYLNFTPGDNDLNNLNLHLIEMLNIASQMVKTLTPLLWTHPTCTCSDHDLNKLLESTLPEEASISFNFTGQMILEKIIKI